MARHRLSKSTYIRSLQCQKSLYLHIKRPFLRDKISAEQLAKFRRGSDVGILARELFPGGTDMSPKSPSAYAAKREETLSMLRQESVDVLYEAVFEYDEVLIMLDILVRDNDGWKAIEVKSSRKLSTTYYHDAALQYYVLKGNGLKITSFCLIHINEDYVLDGNLQLHDLFSIVEVQQELESMLDTTSKAIASAKQTISLDKSPVIAPGLQCHMPYTCDFLGHCWKNLPANNILLMRSLEAETASSLFKYGRYLPEDIIAESKPIAIHPSELEAFTRQLLTTTHEGIKQIEALTAIHTRPLYLKILSLQPAVPAIPGCRPYQHLPLAISWDNGGKNSQSFETNAAGLAQAKALLTELIELHDLVITDDLKSLVDIFQPQPSIVKNKLFGIRQLAEDLPLFHPGFGPEYPFGNIAKALTGKTLASEHWLAHDLMASEEDAQTKKILFKLDQYTDALKIVWSQITEIKKEA